MHCQVLYNVAKVVLQKGTNYHCIVNSATICISIGRLKNALDKFVWEYSALTLGKKPLGVRDCISYTNLKFTFLIIYSQFKVILFT